MLMPREEGEEYEERVGEFAAHFPRRNFGWVRLTVKVVHATVQPIPVPVAVKFLKVSELVQRVVLQVVA